MTTDPFKTHAFHRFRKEQMRRPECASMDEPVREAWIMSLYEMQERGRAASRCYRGTPTLDLAPRLGAPSAEWTGPNGNRYIFVPGEAP